MDDQQNTPEATPPEEPIDPRAGHEPAPIADRETEFAGTILPEGMPQQQETAPVPPELRLPQPQSGDGRAAEYSYQDAALQKRSFRQNLFLLLSLALAAFILTSWILVRVDSLFGMFATGPQEVVRAQLRALDRGELRPAYDMFSARYRGEVSFDTWHELFVTHWRMFHADVVRAETPAFTGPGVTLEIFLHGADDKDYRARFTLIRTDGRWWIDDVHWTEEADEHDIFRT